MTRLDRRVRRRLARTPLGSLWRGSRRRLGGTGPTGPTVPTAPEPAIEPGSESEDIPAEPYPLDTSVYELDASAEPEQAAAVLQGAFGHGYLVSSTPVTLPGLLEGWARTRVRGLHLRTAPRTVVTVAEDADGAVVVLGHPLDVDGGTADPSVIAAALLARRRAGGHEAAVRQASYLAGRWTVLLLTGAPSAALLTVLPDTMASQPVYYAPAADAVTVGSADTLVALARDLPVDPAAQRLAREIRSLRPTGVTYLPGRVTSYVGVEQLVPNCLLRVELAHPGTVRHERFWPVEERVERTDLASVHAEFADRLRRQLVLVRDLGPTAWSLTGGLDSRVLLAHDGPPGPDGPFAFTYFNPRDGVRDPGAARDVFVANELAHRLGMPHRVLRWRRADPASTFGRLHAATYPVTTVSHGAAHAMWADLPHDLVQIQGNGGEIGTVFGTSRPPGRLTPALAARLWLGRAFADLPRYQEIFADYLAHAQLDEARLHGYSHHDVLYWEHRMGRWGWTKFLAGDLSHRVLPPFNDRRLLEIMLSLPEEQRIGKTLYDRVLQGAPLLQVAAE